MLPKDSHDPFLGYQRGVLGYGRVIHAIEGDEDDRDTICNTPRRDGTRVFWEMGRAVTCQRCVAELAKRDRRLCRSMGFPPRSPPGAMAKRQTEA